MNLNIYEIEERNILQCEEIRPEDVCYGRIDFSADYPIHGGLSDNM